MMSLLYVFLGGGIGSICRYWIGKMWDTSQLPYGTLTANIISCVILGFLIGLSAHQLLKSEHRLLLMTGFCGGFSTFSTFSGEIVQLYQDGQILAVGTYVAGSITAGVLSILAGMYLAKLIF